MNNLSIEVILEHIEKIAGGLYEFGTDDLDETITYFFNDYPDLSLEIDRESLNVSIYMSFPYYDFSESEIHSGKVDREDLDCDIRNKILESAFELFLKSKSDKCLVSVWDDGSYMCPGYCSRVGFSDERFSETIIKEFFDCYNEFISKYYKLDNIVLVEYIFMTVCHEYGVKVDDLNRIGDCSRIEFGENELEFEENVDNYYLGKEYFLFSSNDNTYYTNNLPVSVFFYSKPKVRIIWQGFFLFRCCSINTNQYTCSN